jgi:tetratricopeptide (TPR) repeat protein
LGVTYEKENNQAEAEKSYVTALSIRPDYYDAAYNMGAMYYNQAQAKSKVCNDIPPRETDKFNACKSELKPIYLKAAEYFEICYKQEPNDSQLKQALKETYLKGGNREKSATFN